MTEFDNFAQSLNNKPVAIFGLGLSGMSALRVLRAAGVAVLVSDDDEGRSSAAEELGAEFTVLSEENLADCAFLLLAPGVPLHYPQPHRVVEAARKTGTEIICDLELLHRIGHDCKTIGITGTNGKSTTTALIQHVLAECGIEAIAGGNIGKPVFDMEMPGSGGALVLELSSFQLDLCPTFAPDISVLLNITPDHIDRHGNMRNYAASKASILKGDGAAIISVDDDSCRKIYRDLQNSNQREISVISIVHKGGVEFCADLNNVTYVKDGVLFDKGKEIGSLHDMKIKGPHNWQNAAAAYLVAKKMGLDSDMIMRALETFPGLPHRQFPVCRAAGISYVNDSKATNAQAAAKALASFNNIFWIVGGRSKEGGLTGLEDFMDRVCHAFLIGEAASKFAHWMEDNNVQFSMCKTLDNAFDQAHHMAQDNHDDTGVENVVLLSPACASFDQFKSFEERGDYFTKLVKSV